MIYDFPEIDAALNEGDLKRVEVLIAHQLRDNSDPEKRPDLLFRRAQARLLAGKADDALEDMRAGLALDGSRQQDADLSILSGDIYFARFELSPVGFTDRSHADHALEQYLSVIQNHSDHPRVAWVYYQLGRVYLSQDQVEKAKSNFEAALASRNDPPQVHALSHERLGYIELFENRQPGAALKCFQLAIKHYPAQSNAAWLVDLYLQMSRAYLELEHSEEALEVANKALREIRNSALGAQSGMLAEAYMTLGNIMATVPGSESEAIEHYLRFLQSSRRPPGIDVTWSNVYERIGTLAFRLERYKDAINAYESALAFNPYHPLEVNLRYQIARCNYRTRSYEQTVESLQTMRNLAQEPITDWQVFTLLGSAYFALEKYAEAVVAYRRALELAPPGARNLEKTEIYLRFSEELSNSTR